MTSQRCLRDVVERSPRHAGEIGSSPEEAVPTFTEHRRGTVVAAVNELLMNARHEAARASQLLLRHLHQSPVVITKAGIPIDVGVPLADVLGVLAPFLEDLKQPERHCKILVTP